MGVKKQEKILTTEKDLGKLGTVLSMCLATTKDALYMLKEQQRRQVRMIWASLGIVCLAVFILGMAFYVSFTSLSAQIEHNGELIRYVHEQEISERLP